MCAHPAIDEAARTPLMLQTVLGLDARSIAHAFAVRPSTMAQRLVRAKRRIRDARIPFTVPARARMAERAPGVLEAIYGAYAIDWQLVSGTTIRESLAAEAHYLAVTLADLLGEEPEAFGLAALISLSLARATARGSPGEYVPLEEQDASLWDVSLIAQGEQFLRRAHAFGRIGRFQLEAAIQSAHCARRSSGVTDWAALRKLYAALVAVAPTLGAHVANAAVIARVHGAEAGLAALDAITDPALRRFQPAWATCAHLLVEAGRPKRPRTRTHAPFRSPPNRPYGDTWNGWPHRAQGRAARASSAALTRARGELHRDACHGRIFGVPLTRVRSTPGGSRHEQD